MTIQEVEVEIDMIIDQFGKEGKNLGPNLTPGVNTNHDRVRCYTC